MSHNSSFGCLFFFLSLLPLISPFYTTPTIKITLVNGTVINNLTSFSLSGKFTVSIPPNNSSYSYYNFTFVDTSLFTENLKVKKTDDRHIHENDVLRINYLILILIRQFLKLIGIQKRQKDFLKVPVSKFVCVKLRETENG